MLQWGTRPPEEPLKPAAGTQSREQAPPHENAHCSICLIRPSDHLLVPCGHLGFCGQCIQRIDDTCPFCRAGVESKIKVYFAGIPDSSGLLQKAALAEETTIDERERNAELLLIIKAKEEENKKLQAENKKRRLLE